MIGDTGEFSEPISHRIYVWYGSGTYLWLIFTVNVRIGKYTVAWIISARIFPGSELALFFRFCWPVDRLYGLCTKG